MKRRSSLEYRLCLLVMGLLFAMLFAIGHVQMTGQRQALLEEKTEKFESLSKVLALTYTPMANKSDWALYREFTRRFMDTDKDISYVIITDAYGKVLFADSGETSPHQYKNFIGKQASRLMSLVGGLRDSNPETMRVNVPAMVGKDQRGMITVAFGSRSLVAAIEAMQTKLLTTFAFAFLAGLIGSILLAKAIICPLKKLITAARAVTAGDLNVSVPVSSHDEIGELTDSFNTMVASLKETTEKLIERANLDSLTGLYNHRYFQERVRSEIKRAERYSRPMSVIMLDIDHFKSLNDAHGHPVGDAVLVDLAEVLLAEARRDIDIITRYGGEEFALILPETELEGARFIAERIRLGVQRHAFQGKDVETVPVTISLGIAQYPIHSAEPEGLIMAADLAMYQSKSMGRNMTTSFNRDLRPNQDNDPYKLYLLLHATDMGTIEAMAAAVDAKSQRPPGYTRELVAHSVALAQQLGMSEDEQNDVRIATLLHDIGKLGISEAILSKEESLTKEELAIVQSHPILGHAIIQKSPHLKSMLPGILSHHEWWDGNGYPEGLAGEKIPRIARIIAVVDAYYAMITDRPHRKRRTAKEAAAEILKCSGLQFDPTVVEAFLGMLGIVQPELQNAA